MLCYDNFSPLNRDLQRRGCVRTAFEFARLLYSLDPWGDPHGALLHLDYLAVKCGMWQWLLDVWEFFEQWWTKDKQKNRVNVTFLPGWAYARALSLKAQEDAKKDKVSFWYSQIASYSDNVFLGSRGE